MKKLITTLSLALLFAAMLNAQNVPNGGFEAWTDGEPNEWDTSNLPTFTTITQSDDSHSGTYAVRGQSVEKDNENIVPEIECDGGVNGAGFPVDQDYTFFNFWLKFDDGNNDHLEVFVIMRDADLQTIAVSSMDIEDKYESYDQVVVPIVYDGAGAAYCTIQILITGGLGEPSLDSWFLIDDMELVTATGEIEKISTGTFNIFPNPASGNFNISIPENADYTELEIVNHLGQKIYSRLITQNEKTIVISRLDNWKAGVYFIRLKGTGIQTTQEIILK